MRARTFYTAVILLPAVALTFVAPFAGPPMVTEAPLPAGATEVWIYPRFAIRELAAYGLVATWLLWQLRTRPLPDFARLIWWAPVAMVGASFLMLLPLVLVHGALRQVVADDSGRVVLRLVARLAIGYGYIGLAEVVRTRLVQIEPTASAASPG